jgi:hypothetical protein
MIRRRRVGQEGESSMATFMASTPGCHRRHRTLRLEGSGATLAARLARLDKVGAFALTEPSSATTPGAQVGKCLEIFTDE